MLAYPLLLLAVMGLPARAMLFDCPDSPFSNNEIQGGEALLIAPALLIV